MSKRKFFFFIPWVLLVVNCGGGSVDSSDLKTQGIHATVRIGASESTTYVDARLTAGGPNGSDVELSLGDRLTATAYGETKLLRREPQLFGAYDSYIVEFQDNIPGEVLRLNLSRESDPDAPNSYITIPATVNVTAPSGDGVTTVAIDETVDLVWDRNYEGDVTILVGLSCTALGEGKERISFSSDTTISDQGSFSFTFFESVDVDSRNEIDTDYDCEGRASIERLEEGVLDPNFDGGNIKISQYAAVKFVVYH